MASLAAILRAARPVYRDDADRLAFAAHAFMLSLGYRLTACGEAAEGDAPLDPQAAEVGPEGWQSLAHGTYAFRYALEEEGSGVGGSSSSGGGAAATKQKQVEEKEKKPSSVLVKAVTAGDGALAVSWCKKGDDEQEKPLAPMATLVLHFRDWLVVDAAPSSATSSSAGESVSRFKDLSKLEQTLRDALDRGVGLEGEKKKKEEEVPEGGGGVSGGGGRPPPPPPIERDYPQPPPPHPVPSIGADDLYPPGLGPGLPGIAHPFPGGGGIGVGGSSQVGPGHPLFGERPPGSVPRPPGGLPGMGGGGQHPIPGMPPGARWDPINPPGVPGFLPDDFRGGGGRGRGGGRGVGGPPFHPDIMPPGPGGPGFGGGGGGGNFGGGFI